MTTESLVNLYCENQITYEEFTKLPEVEIQRIIDKSKAAIEREEESNLFELARV